MPYGCDPPSYCARLLTNQIRSKLEEEENTREMCELELRDAKGSIDRLQAEYLALEERLLEKTTEAERHDSELKSLKVRLKEVEYESQQDVRIRWAYHAICSSCNSG